VLSLLPISRLRGIEFPAIPDGHAATQLALQYQLESSQWWSPEKLQSHQFAQLRIVLVHAVASVPYYQRLFGSRGLDIPERITPEFFGRIPVSTRKAIQDAGSDLESTALPADHGAAEFSNTSGSTGRPVRFARTALTKALWLSFALRDHLWYDRDFSGKLGAIRWFPRGTAEAPDGGRESSWGVIVAPVFATGPSVTLNVVATPEQQVDWLQREQLDYLVSFPSNLLALVRFAREKGIALPPLRQVRTIGESLSDAARDEIAAAWQCTVVDIYTCEEAGYLALQCPESGDYHVQAENVILEIVDERGQPCPPGQVGQVLITTLNNFATPLIRYELGDMAEFGAPCSCGRGLPLIRRIHGRKRSRLRLPSGESVFPYLGEHGAIQRATGVALKQFQCVQHSLEEVEVKLVMERPLDDAQQAAVIALTQRNLGYPFRVRLSFPAEIPRGPTGKFEEFVSLIAD
jgi:phenylacetate-CoA ligase